MSSAGPTVRQLDVLIVADPRDRQAYAVAAAVSALGATAACLNLADMAHSGCTVDADGMRVGAAHGAWAVGQQTRVWWHRSGSYDTAGFDNVESRLAQEESFAALLGALAACDVTWTDNPVDVERAELKLLQLSAAAALGIATPAWIVTNEIEVAGRFVGAGPTLAKALSAGEGIAPFAGEVGPNDVLAVSSLPTFFQRVVAATADLRVVVVADHVWVWRRERVGAVIDWRAADPHGRDFAQVASHEVVNGALELSRALRLTMSVQDWLETLDGPVMLEVNPQGKWAFLSGALELVAPVLASELVKR